MLGDGCERENVGVCINGCKCICECLSVCLYARIEVCVLSVCVIRTYE